MLLFISSIINIVLFIFTPLYDITSKIVIGGNNFCIPLSAFIIIYFIVTGIIGLYDYNTRTYTLRNYNH